MKLVWRTNDTSVVASVAEQTAAAADLAGIDGQDRLADPRTNPAVRGHADQLRDDQHKRALDAEHERLLRRHRVADRRAEHAERALDAIQAAREASSAARSVLALHQGRTRFMGAALAASLSLSAGSAMGVAALAEKLDAPAAVGYIAEVGLTGLTTAVILYRSHLAQHGGRLTGWKAGALWLLMVGPLVASMVANTFGSGAVGVACSVGAASFSLLSYVIADASAEALQLQAGRVTGEDESQLREIATASEANQPRTGTTNRNREPEVRNLPVICSANFGSTLLNQRTANREPEVREPVRNRAAICSGTSGLLPLPTTRTTIHGPWNLNRRTTEPQASPELEPEPTEANHQAPEPGPRPVRRPRTTGTANLGDRAAKKSAEVQQVLNLMDELGYDAVSLDMVRNRLGLSKTTAYHRLTEARELRNQNREPANRNRARRDDEPEPVREAVASLNQNHAKEATG